MPAPWVMMVASSESCTSATATMREPSASVAARAKNSTFCEVTRLMVGALMARVDTGLAITLSMKPAGSASGSRAPRRSDEATTTPRASTKAMWRTSRFCRTTLSSSRWSSKRPNSTPALPTVAPRSSSLAPASSMSTLSSERLSAASEPLTKRTARFSWSLIAFWRPSQMMRLATAATVARKSTATP